MKNRHFFTCDSSSKFAVVFQCQLTPSFMTDVCSNVMTINSLSIPNIMRSYLTTTITTWTAESNKSLKVKTYSR